MTATYLGSPLQRLARLMSKTDGSCVDASYEQFISHQKNISWNLDNISKVKIKMLYEFQTVNNK